VIWDAATALTLSAGAGVDNPLNDDVRPAGRTFNGRLFTNAFVKATDAVLVIAEYGYMTTRFATESIATNKRAQVALQYSF